MNIPANLRYTNDHEWAQDNGDGSYTVGVTDFAQDSLGGIVYVELAAEGTRVSAGQRFGTVESTKSVSELYAPISGVIAARNTDLDAAPDTVNSDPYGAWMVRIAAESSGEFEALMDASAYAAHTAG
jgi:glycine cleavage system H protein